MTAIFTPNQISFEMDFSTINLQMLSFDKELSHFFPGPFHETGEGRTRNFHFDGRFVVILALIIRQPDSLKLVQGQSEIIEKPRFDSSRLEPRVNRWTLNRSIFLRPGHQHFSVFRYAYIMHICA